MFEERVNLKMGELSAPHIVFGRGYLLVPGLNKRVLVNATIDMHYIKDIEMDQDSDIKHHAILVLS